MMRCYVLIAVLASLTAVVASIGIADDVNAKDENTTTPGTAPNTTATDPGKAPETTRTDPGIAPATTTTDPGISPATTTTDPEIAPATTTDPGMAPATTTTDPEIAPVTTRTDPRTATETTMTDPGIVPETTNPGIIPETTDPGIAPGTIPTTPIPSYRWTPTHPFTDTDRAIVGITCIVCGLVFIGAAIYGCARRQQMKKDKDAMYKRYMSTVGGPDLANDNPTFER